ncbi:MAG: cell division protein FtsA [Candidatus Krumholzibacteria bacterium]|nr:cell division protein FtsA [Candidatus Krumholzibacteria bacterium]
MHPEFIVSVDFGTTKIAATVGEYLDGQMKIIGAASRPSAGIRKGMIIDIEDAAACVGEAVEQAEKMAGLDIEGVCAGISGPHVRSINSRGMVTIPSDRGEVTYADVERVTEAAGNIILPADMEILHTIPLDFMVDKQRGISDPTGMHASRLGVEVHIVTAQTAFIENLRRVFERVGIEMINTVFQPIACAHAVVKDEEMASGCLVIDVGGGITDYALYHGGFVRVSGVIPAGGENITRDIAIGLRIPESVANDVKLKYGLALESLAGEDEIVLLPGEQENGGREVRKKIIAAIIEPRCEEIFEMVKNAVSSSPWFETMGGGVVLTGGGSKLMGMKSVAGQVFDLPVRKGLPDGLSGLSEVVADEIWSAVVGLMFFESDRINKEASRKRHGGSFRLMLDRIRKIASLFL